MKGGAESSDAKDQITIPLAAPQVEGVESKFDAATQFITKSMFTGINFSNPDGMAALRHLLRAFMGLFEICIIDFQKWKPLFDNIPLKIEIYEAIFEDMINAMNGKEDPSKKKTIGESSGSALISGSARPATRRRRSQASTGSGA
jgi:hypothetical protein